MDDASPEIVVCMAPAPETLTVCVLPPPCTPYRTEWPVMSPLRWMQSTAPHWTVMLENVTSDTLTKVGAADGAGRKAIKIEEREETGNDVY